MSTLKEKAQEILNEKTINIIPDNIKKNEIIFDITGSYEGEINRIGTYSGYAKKCLITTIPELVWPMPQIGKIDGISVASVCSPTFRNGGSSGWKFSVTLVFSPAFNDTKNLYFIFENLDGEEYAYASTTVGPVTSSSDYVVVSSISIYKLADNQAVSDADILQMGGITVASSLPE